MTLPAKAKAELAAALAEYRASQQRQRPAGNWFTLMEIAETWGLSRVQTQKLLFRMRHAGRAEMQRVGKMHYHRVKP